MMGNELVFAEVRYPGGYADVHTGIVKLMEDHFSNVRSGLQGDSWIWIADGDDKVAIDTFSSMTHLVKSYINGPYVQRVIGALRTQYDVLVFDEPREDWS